MVKDLKTGPCFVRGEPVSAVTAICCTPVELYCLDSDMLLSLGIQDDEEVRSFLLSREINDKMKLLD